MFHLVARAVTGTVLFRTWSEARKLWDLLVEALVQPKSLMLMPDHVHSIVVQPTPRFGRALSAYARWRNAQRGESGRAWQRSPPPARLADATHARRTVRYNALNPSRKGIVRDPLQWTFSTHRDAVGLVLHPVRPKVRDPIEHHAYVSADPSVHVDGTSLPVRGIDVPTERQVEAVVSELLRTPLGEIRSTTAGRRLLIQLGRDWAGWRTNTVAAFVDVSTKTVWRAPQLATSTERLAATIAGDSRFPGLIDGDLLRLPGWEPYRGRR
jgi:REP element-mobilizing transposase RayT